MDHVDVRGEVCPRPALIVRRRLTELDPGETLVVEGDYPPAEGNLRRTCDTHGFDVQAGDVEDGFELHITVTEDASLSEA